MNKKLRKLGIKLGICLSFFVMIGIKTLLFETKEEYGI